MRLRAKVALVTGAGGGFGAGIARLFAAEGAQVVVADIDADAARRIAGEIGGHPVAGDVSRAGDVQAMVDAATQNFGGLDILVNNAGTTHRNQPMLDVDEAMFDRVYAVNVRSLFNTARAAIPVLRRQGRGGAIVNIGSTAGIRPRPGLVWYNGSKAAVNTITQGMALELAQEKIRVNAVCPVLGETGLTEAFMGGPATPELLARFVATIPLGRLSQPEDSAAFITGVLLPVDGGRTV
jgi:3-oxoacyl-[acyl-carrier protein] reductase